MTDVTGDDDAPLTFAAYAKRRGCSRPLISKRVVEGIIHGPALTADRKIIPSIADAQLAEAADPAQASARLPASDDSSYARQRARKTAAEAELAEIALRTRKGQLVERTQIAAVLSPRLRELRDAILATPRDTVADEADAAACEEALRKQLEEFSTRLARLAMEHSDDGGAGAGA